MALWIPITLAAGCLQIARTGLQKSLQADLDDYTTAWTRHVFALPFAPLILLAVHAAYDASPVITPLFLLYCFIAGAFQIIATLMLLALFSRRNFAVSTAFAKTEAVQIALLGALVFGEPPSLFGMCGIIVGGAGVFLMIPRRKPDSSVLIGLAAGALFALTSWLIRLCYDEIQAENAFVGAAWTLTVMLIMQSLMLGVVVAARKSTDWRALWRARYRALNVGITGLLGSYCWFTGFMLTNPAYVKTLAQIELPLAFLLGRAAFREKPNRWEIAGMTAAGGGALLVTLA